MWYKKAAEAGDKEAILKEFEVLLYSGFDECKERQDLGDRKKEGEKERSFALQSCRDPE